MYRALYRKWRPVDFDDVWGQDQVTEILKYEVAAGKISHAYLFCGSRGTGKTSSAKILAKAVNCLAPENGNPCNRCEACRAIDAGTAPDVIEMDAASNTGVDDVRDIREEIVFTPAELKYRVYIIDEVHMMTGNAFNALLKTLEEPPSHVIFILATTELHKLPTTIVSRCQRFDFRRITNAVLAKRLLHIASHEGIDLTEGGARLLARLALGGMRDAISLLELCAGLKGTVDEALVATACGAGDNESVYRLAAAVQARDHAAMYAEIHAVVMSSRDLTVFWQDFIDCYRDMMVMKSAPNAVDYLDLSDSEAERLRTLAEGFSMEQLIFQSRMAEDALAKMQRSGISRRAAAELALTRMCEPKLVESAESLALRIAELERAVTALRAGIVEAPAAPAAPEKEAPKPASAPAPQAKSKQEPPPSVGPAGVPTLRAFSAWREVTEELIRSQKSLAGVLQGTRAFLTDNGGLIVRVANPFFRMMLSRDENIAAIRAVCESVAGVRVTAVTVESADAPTTLSFLDENEGE